MLHLLLLPFHLALWLLLGILWIPFLLLRFILRVVTGLILLPIFLAVMLVGLIVGGLAFFIPLAVIGLFVWFVIFLIRAPRHSVI